MVRCGIRLYGLTRSIHVTAGGFWAVAAWKTRVISFKSMPQGHGISYGHRLSHAEGERIGAIAVGSMGMACGA
jgi:alanine racemase